MSNNVTITVEDSKTITIVTNNFPNREMVQVIVKPMRHLAYIRISLDALPSDFTDDDFQITVSDNKYIFTNTELDLTSLTKQGLLATFVYGNPDNEFTATVDWGDGSPVEPATVTYADGKGVVTGTHEYGGIGVEGNQLTATVTVTDLGDVDKVGQFLVTLHVPQSLPTVDDYVVNYNPGTAGIGFRKVNASVTWEDFFAQAEVYDFISIHDVAGHDGFPMELNQCVILTNYVANMSPADPDYANMVARADWDKMVTGALSRSKWLMMYIGGCRWGYGFNALENETKEEYVARALAAMKPVLDSLPDCIGLDTVMGIRVSDLENYDYNPLAAHHAKIVYGPDGAEAMIVAEIQRRGIRVVVEPYITTEATYLNSVGTITAYGTWHDRITDGNWVHNMAVYGGNDWEKTGNTVTFNVPSHGIASGSTIGIQFSSNPAELPVGSYSGNDSLGQPIVRRINSDVFTVKVVPSAATPVSGFAWYYRYHRRSVRPTADSTPAFVYMNSGYNDPVGYLAKILEVQTNGCVPQVLIDNIPAGL